MLLLPTLHVPMVFAGTTNSDTADLRAENAELHKRVNELEAEVARLLAMRGGPSHSRKTSEAFAESSAESRDRMTSAEAEANLLRKQDAQLEAVAAAKEQAQRENVELVMRMGEMLKKAIAEQARASSNEEKKANAGPRGSVDINQLDDMFFCFHESCGYANSSTRLVCHKCGRRRFADIRTEKERTVMDINHEQERRRMRRLWVTPLVDKCVPVMCRCALVDAPCDATWLKLPC